MIFDINNDNRSDRIIELIKTININKLVDDIIFNKLFSTDSVNINVVNSNKPYKIAYDVFSDDIVVSFPDDTVCGRNYSSMDIPEIFLQEADSLDEYRDELYNILSKFINEDNFLESISEANEFLFKELSDFEKADLLSYGILSSLDINILSMFESSVDLELPVVCSFNKMDYYELSALSREIVEVINVNELYIDLEIEKLINLFDVTKYSELELVNIKKFNVKSIIIKDTTDNKDIVNNSLNIIKNNFELLSKLLHSMSNGDNLEINKNNAEKINSIYKQLSTIHSILEISKLIIYK